MLPAIKEKGMLKLRGPHCRRGSHIFPRLERHSQTEHGARPIMRDAAGVSK